MASLIGLVSNNSPDLLEEVREAIAQGVDVNKVTEYGESALRIASRNGRFDVVAALLSANADRNQLHGSSTIFEVIYGTSETIQKSVHDNGDLESVDYWQRTPFLFAVQLGDKNKAQLLLDLGANQNAVGRCGMTPMQYAVQQGNVPMLQWLLDRGFDVDATDEFLQTPLIFAAEEGMSDCVSFLIEAGADIHKADHIPQRAIQVAANLDIVRVLVSHGADINDINAEMHAKLLGIEHEADPQVSAEDFANGKNRRFGTRNPERMDDPFWLAMVRSGASGWQAGEKFSEPGGTGRLPIWSYQRFGRSTTVLDDGRIIEIAGEHEDGYDPDFCIYNDVTVFGTDGSISIYGYPADVFSPTDFHTATLSGGFILIIGCLGYPQERRFGSTPICRLNVQTFEIQRIETTGACPGWIHGHKAKLDGLGRIVISGGEIEKGQNELSNENIDDWALDLDTWNWTRLTDRAWPQWAFARADDKPNHLWQIRQALWTRDANWTEEFQRDMGRLSESLGHEPDLDAVGSLYEVKGLTSGGLGSKSEARTPKVYVDGIAIRIRESNWLVQVMAEGNLADDRVEAFQEGVLANLARLEGVAWSVRHPPKFE